MTTLLEKTFNILLVEDNAAHVRLFREAFKVDPASLTIRAVRDGIEAIAYLHQKDQYVDAVLPDLIVLDLNLPRKNGHEVLAEVKTDPALRKIPVLVLTTSNSPDDINKAYTCYANCYLVKPRNLTQLFKVAERIQEFWLETATLAV